MLSKRSLPEVVEDLKECFEVSLPSGEMYRQMCRRFAIAGGAGDSSPLADKADKLLHADLILALLADCAEWSGNWLHVCDMLRWNRRDLRCLMDDTVAARGHHEHDADDAAVADGRCVRCEELEAIVANLRRQLETRRIQYRTLAVRHGNVLADLLQAQSDLKRERNRNVRRALPLFPSGHGKFSLPCKFC